MMQEVIIQRSADRHAYLHERAYSEAYRLVVDAGDLGEVLAAAINGLVLPRGRYVIEVGWPYEDPENCQLCTGAGVIAGGVPGSPTIRQCPACEGSGHD